ncbi:hypothetical protein CFBP6109_03030 [Pseudomonas syringae pv. cerasicola]|nr:hypothetical protein CFBP6109_03030 [Pseudomonas syringae pv. cerasicola]SPF14807.1 hypothetical protein PSCFBP6110_02303 [Pseudomonas syringae pv. cerasicola]
MEIPSMMLRVSFWRRTVCSGEDAERPERHTHAEHGHDSVLADSARSSRSSVGMPFMTLRVSFWRRTVCSGEDAERPERHTHAEHRHDSVPADSARSSRSSVGMPFMTLRVTGLDLHTDKCSIRSPCIFSPGLRLLTASSPILIRRVRVTLRVRPSRLAVCTWL